MMRKAMQIFGLYLIAAGISGTIDHLAYQPINLFALNFFNRVVIPHVSFLKGFEVFANLTLAAIGVIIIAIAERVKTG